MGPCTLFTTSIPPLQLRPELCRAAVLILNLSSPWTGFTLKAHSICIEYQKIAMIQLECGHPRSQHVLKQGVAMNMCQIFFYPIGLKDTELNYSCRSTWYFEHEVQTCGYNAERLVVTGIDLTNSKLTYAQSLVAEHCADRQLSKGSERPIIFICYELGGLLVERTLANSHCRVDKAARHLTWIHINLHI